MTCKTMPPATTGEVVLVFQMTGAAAETGGCCILAETDCNAALGRHDWDTTTDDSGDATLMTGCGIVGACDVDGVECDDARCNRQTRQLFAAITTITSVQNREPSRLTTSCWRLQSPIKLSFVASCLVGSVSHGHEHTVERGLAISFGNQLCNSSGPHFTTTTAWHSLLFTVTVKPVSTCQGPRKASMYKVTKLLTRRPPRPVP